MCGRGKLSSLVNGFVFIQYGDCSEVSETTFILGKEEVAMGKVVTNDFVPVFEGRLRNQERCTIRRLFEY